MKTEIACVCRVKERERVRGERNSRERGEVLRIRYTSVFAARDSRASLANGGLARVAIDNRYFNVKDFNI